ncbi:hypothetical protein LK07_32630 [Streptomyces pluripotens]|uniref:Uncharacterized protein n=1 Tax=Streptomyces pluripotens TaxID=1355015 RepID=A0A221P7J7_9ACTN|nr:hypothetical protein LK06_031430 [Streptomyces pluripotens]ASN27978.1 hypothetical protein LK07_32630 [Streptomyces pluripotens]
MLDTPQGYPPNSLRLRHATNPAQLARGHPPIKLTVSEIRHLLAAVFNTPAMSTARLLHWSDWRREHQATARRSHYRRHSADEPTGSITKPHWSTRPMCHPVPETTCQGDNPDSETRGKHVRSASVSRQGGRRVPRGAAWGHVADPSRTTSTTP